MGRLSTTKRQHYKLTGWGKEPIRILKKSSDEMKILQYRFFFNTATNTTKHERLSYIAIIKLLYFLKTDHYENSSHTAVSRGCTDEPCEDLHEGGGPYCTMANDVTRCTSCCTASKCNDKKSSSDGLTSSCVTWLTSLFSLVIMLITYRT